MLNFADKKNKNKIVMGHLFSDNRVIICLQKSANYSPLGLLFEWPMS